MTYKIGLVSPQAVVRNTRLRQKHNRIDVSSEFCSATLAVNERNWSLVHADLGPHRNDGFISKEIVRKLTMNFQSASRPVFVVAHLRQIQTSKGFSCLFPNIVVGRTLPDDSLLFTVVRSGNVRQLQGMISHGNATLRDRNSRGTPLLHVSFRRDSANEVLIYDSTHMISPRCANF